MEANFCLGAVRFFRTGGAIHTAKAVYQIVIFTLIPNLFRPRTIYPNSLLALFLTLSESKKVNLQWLPSNSSLPSDDLRLLSLKLVPHMTSPPYYSPSPIIFLNFYLFTLVETRFQSVFFYHQISAVL